MMRHRMRARIRSSRVTGRAGRATAPWSCRSACRLWVGHWSRPLNWLVGRLDNGGRCGRRRSDRQDVAPGGVLTMTVADLVAANRTGEGAPVGDGDDGRWSVEEDGLQVCAVQPSAELAGSDDRPVRQLAQFGEGGVADQDAEQRPRRPTLARGGTALRHDDERCGPPRRGRADGAVVLGLVEVQLPLQPTELVHDDGPPMGSSTPSMATVPPKVTAACSCASSSRQAWSSAGSTSASTPPAPVVDQPDHGREAQVGALVHEEGFVAGEVSGAGGLMRPSQQVEVVNGNRPQAMAASWPATLAGAEADASQPRRWAPNRLSPATTVPRRCGPSAADLPGIQRPEKRCRDPTGPAPCTAITSMELGVLARRVDRGQRTSITSCSTSRRSDRRPRPPGPRSAIAIAD